MIFYLRNAKLDVDATPMSQAVGGEGYCCRIARRPRESLKIYQHPVPEDLEARLTYMLANPPATLRSHIAWPLDMVEHGQGEVVGYLQHHFPAYYIPLTAIYSNPTRPRWATPAVLRRCAYEVAYILAELHAHEYLFPDIHGSQFLVAKHRHTVLIDAASCQFTSAGRLYPCIRVRDEYQAQELLGAANWAEVADQRDPYTDSWSLTVLIFQLTLGCHPFDGTYIGSGAALPPLERAKHGYFPFERLGHEYRPPKNVPPYRHVDPDVRDFFHRNFVEGHARENRRCRPTAAEWADLLRHCPQLRIASRAITSPLPLPRATSGRLILSLTAHLDPLARFLATPRCGGWTTAIALAGLAGIAAACQQLATRDAARDSFPVFVRPNNHQHITSVPPDADPTTPSIDSLLQRFRNQSNHQKEPEL